MTLLRQSRPNGNPQALLFFYRGFFRVFFQNSCILFKTAEHNLNLDEQPNLESREGQGQLGEQAVERKRGDEDGEMNNDEKSDDEEMAIQGNGDSEMRKGETFLAE